MIRLSGASAGEPHLVGPSAYIGSLPKRQRRIVNYVLFTVAAGVILAVAEPFADSLTELGEALGISTFLLVKWLAPLASEAPELPHRRNVRMEVDCPKPVSARSFHRKSISGLCSWEPFPLSSRYSLSSWVGLPLDSVQRIELWVTAAQSVFAVAIIASRSVTRKEALVMLTLFIAQLGESWLAEIGVISETVSEQVRIGVGVVFLIAAAWVLRKDFGIFGRVLKEGFRAPWSVLEADEETV